MRSHLTGLRLPDSWEWRPLWQLTQPGRPITYGIVQAGPDVPDGVPYIRPVDMSEEHGLKPGVAPRRTAPEIAAAYRRSVIAADDLVVTIGPSYGKVMLVPPELAGANLTQGTARVAPDNSVVDGRYLRWALRSTPIRDAWSTAVGGATFGGLNLGPLSDSLVPVPQLDEQRRIADYLDTETARIDRLRTRNEELARLARERHERFVLTAVTEGVDPAVTPSAVGGWIASFNDSFTIGPYAMYGRTGSGHTPSRSVPEYWNECNIPWITTGDVKPLRPGFVEYLDDTSEKISELGMANSAARLHPAGTVVLSRTASVGFAGIMAVPMATSQDFFTWTPDQGRLRSEYLLWALRAMRYAGHFDRLTKPCRSSAAMR